MAITLIIYDYIMYYVNDFPNIEYAVCGSLETREIVVFPPLRQNVKWQELASSS